MTLRIGNINIETPVFLAPMAGITDLPFRKVVTKFGAGLVVSEMIASQELVQNKPSSRQKAELGFNVANTSVQIAGRDAYWMGECAKLCQDNGAKIIDINMGCPAKKVTNGASGSALMKEPDFALSLIEAVVEAVDVPVTLKMRLGWDDDSINAADIAKRAEDAGVQMITIHGRTRCQFYKGSANWHAIRNVVEAIKAPVIANGDIVDARSAQDALEASGAAGAMIGRGVQGKPWLIAEISGALAGRNSSFAPSGVQLIDLILSHYEDILSFYGVELGLKNARKHLGWYLDQIEGAVEVRSKVLRADNPNDVIDLIRRLEDHPIDDLLAA